MSASSHVIGAGAAGASTVTSAPTGRHTVGDVGPKSAIVRTPSTAARCAGPLSLPTNAAAMRSSASSSANDDVKRTSNSARRARTAASVQRSYSTSPSTKRTRSPRAVSARPRATKRSAGQHLAAAPLPGCRSTGGASLAAGSACAARGAGQSPGRPSGSTASSCAANDSVTCTTAPSGGRGATNASRARGARART
ncbi:MAG: hypothetical protein U0470_08985 [Anaerolineae bacterium]